MVVMTFPYDLLQQAGVERSNWDPGTALAVPGTAKTGDWTCPNTSCGNHNYRFRDVCHLCQVLICAPYLLLCAMHCHVSGTETPDWRLHRAAGGGAGRRLGLQQLLVWPHQLRLPPRLPEVRGAETEGRHRA